MLNLDEYDLKILEILQEDASQSIEQLADRIHLSRNACWRRVKRLEASNVIAGKVALVDPETVELGLLAFVLVKTHEHQSEWLSRFRKAVSSMPEVIGAHRMSGELDYVLRVRLKDVKAYDRFYQRLVAQVPIAEVSASFVMEDIKDTTALPLR